MIGRRVGPYEIVRQIGSGGMGAVYLGARADRAFEKQVAIKLVLRGAESLEILERFRHERQTLASLDHPHIVRLLDGGTTQEGFPYLVMDYVEGEPVLDYCRRHRPPLRDRLNLFLAVCDAAQYAHQHLVVHSDIKPSNVLVTAGGQPRLLDFGIARVLGRGAANADSASLSLHYASPEQVLGKPVTVATDVYALGVLFYEILAGRYPYALGEASEVALAYAITHRAPAAMGFDADLDAIAARAMAKDPARRYSSAERLAGDIRRYLADQPVSARPATPGYLARKFFDRHRAATLAAALAAVATLAGFAGIAWQSHVAGRERARAERRFNEVRQLANAFLFEFEESIRDLPGSTPARVLVVKKAAEYLDRLSGEAAGDTALELELAEAYFRLGDLQGNPYSSNLGDPNGALASYRKAVTICERMLRDSPRDRRAQRYLARGYRQLADVMPMLGNPAEALDYARKAVKTFDELAESRAADLQPKIDAASAYEGLGDQLARSGDRDGALGAYRKSLESWRAAHGVDPTNRRSRRAVGVLAMKIGDTHFNRGEQEPALSAYRQAREALEDFSAADPTSASARRTLGVLYRKMGAALVEFGDPQAGLERFRESTGILDALAAADPDNAQARMDLAIALKSMGETQHSAGDRAGAAKNFSRVIDIVETLSLADPSNLERRAQLAETQVILGGLLQERKLTSLGLTALKQLSDRPGAAASELSLYALSLITCEPAELQDPARALPYAERAAEMTRSADPAILDTLALAAFRVGDAPRAIAAAEKALALLPAGSRTRRIIEAHLAGFRKRP